MPRQSNWRWCGKCQGLAFGGNEHLGHVCPAGGVHDHSLSFDYTLHHDQPAAPQHEQLRWQWCRKCQGLFFNGEESLGVCPAGEGHDGTTIKSYNYVLRYDDPSAPGQEQWRWCSKCQGLFFNGDESLGVCPAGEGHFGGFSFNYTLAERH